MLFSDEHVTSFITSGLVILYFFNATMLISRGAAYTNLCLLRAFSNYLNRKKRVFVLLD